MSTKREWQGQDSTYYCLPQDEEISALIQQNLERKYQAIHQLPLAEAKLKVTFDADYIQRRQGKVTRRSLKISLSVALCVLFKQKAR